MTDILIVDNNAYRNRFLCKQLADEGYRLQPILSVFLLIVWDKFSSLRSSHHQNEASPLWTE